MTQPTENGGYYEAYWPRSPRQLIAVYADPQLDEWPLYALETWVDQSGGKRTRRGMFIDDQFARYMKVLVLIGSIVLCRLMACLKSGSKFEPSRIERMKRRNSCATCSAWSS